MNKHQLLLILLMFLCSSLSQARAIQIGDLLISEVLANPSAVSDGNGEYFELFNTSNIAIDINGFTISDEGSNSHLINSSNSLFVQPGEYFVLGNNGDLNNNGGYIADYVYSDFSLTNSSDEIILSSTDNIPIAQLAFSGAPFGISGTSAELINQLLQPTAADYALSIAVFGNGDRGTPGQAGSVALNTVASPVPVPAAIWLFGSALIIMLKLKRSSLMS